MTTKLKITEIPNQAKHLYIQLYCDKKGGKTNENLYNAAQSWLSLSLTKKQHFYDTISTKAAVKKAQRIIKTEPYLKPKLSTNLTKRKKTKSKGYLNNDADSEQINTNSVSTSVCNDNVMECDNSSTLFVEENYLSETLPQTTSLEGENNTLQEAEQCAVVLRQSETPSDAPKLETESTLQERVQECILENTQSEPQISDAQKLKNLYANVVDEDTNSSKENEVEKVRPPLTEPMLPVAKTGKELFELLKARNGTTKPYVALTLGEKKYYANAVRAIKKDYVKKYKEYLESLSSKQLFDYYMKIF